MPLGAGQIEQVVRAVQEMVEELCRACPRDCPPAIRELLGEGEGPPSMTTK